MTICFETFGCRLNRAEALDQEARYLAAGWTRTESHAEADLIVVRGCSVTRRAEHDCRKLIEHLRKKYPHTRIHVQGCLKERSPERDPGLEHSARAEAVLTSVPTRTARGYLKVQDGCSGRCTFCIVPKFRGKSVSVPFADVLVRARRLMEAGYHELVVTGCNLALYASDGKRLPDLLAALAALGGDYTCRIRLGSLEPGSCANETIDVIADYINLCRFLHLPVQTGSQRVLTAMQRPYTTKDVEATLTHALKRMPYVGLGCDLITGFPGEDELDHQATVGLLKRFPFNNAHVFPFSARPGTVAAALPRQVDRTVSTRRAHDLTEIVRQTRQRYAAKFIGSDVEVVLEDAESRTGWSGEYLSVTAESCLPTAGQPVRKALALVHVTGVHKDRLTGVLTQSSAQSN